MLLVRGDPPHRDYWNTPGGRIDGNETILETLKRELREELPNISSFTVGTLLHAHRSHRDIEGDVSLVLVFYEVDNVTFDGEPRVSEEHTHAEWLPVADAIADPATADSVRAALQRMHM